MKHYLLKYALYEKERDRRDKSEQLLDDLELIKLIIQFIADIKRFDF